MEDLAKFIFILILLPPMALAVIWAVNVLGFELAYTLKNTVAIIILMVALS